MTSCPAWDDDSPADRPRIVANIKGLWPTIETSAGSRTVPDLAMALDWHRAIYAGVAVPDPDYVGNVRDSDPALPCLVDYEVIVGTSPGALARDVPMSLDAYIRAAHTATSALDAATTPGVVPTDPTIVSAVVRLCALGHGEWIRIHPFANGNGRTGTFVFPSIASANSVQATASCDLTTMHVGVVNNMYGTIRYLASDWWVPKTGYYTSNWEYYPFYKPVVTSGRRRLLWGSLPLDARRSPRDGGHVRGDAAGCPSPLTRTSMLSLGWTSHEIT